MAEVRFLLDVLVKQRSLKAHDHWNRQQLEDYQSRMLCAPRRDAYAKSPFYQQFHQGRYDAPLESLPVLTKAAMMDNFDRLVADRAVQLTDISRYMADPGRGEYFRGHYVVNATSGSSGQPSIVIFGKGEWAAVMAAALARTPMGLSFPHRTKRVVFCKKGIPRCTRLPSKSTLPRKSYSTRRPRTRSMISGLSRRSSRSFATSAPGASPRWTRPGSTCRYSR